MNDGLEILDKLLHCIEICNNEVELEKCVEALKKELTEAKKNKNNVERLKILLSPEMLYKYVGLNTGSEILDYARRYVSDILNE